MKMKPTTKKKLKNYGLIAGGVLGSGFLIAAIIRAKRKSDAEKALMEDPNVAAAIMIKQALNPSGFGWMQSWDTTDIEGLYNVAPLITDYPRVVDAYKKLGYGSLTADLVSDLDSTEMAKFMSLIPTAKEIENYEQGTSDEILADYYQDVGLTENPKPFKYSVGQLVHASRIGAYFFPYASNMVNPEGKFELIKDLAIVLKITERKQLEVGTSAQSTAYQNWYKIDGVTYRQIPQTVPIRIMGWMKEDDLTPIT